MSGYALSYELTPDLLHRAMISWDAPERSRAHTRRTFILSTLFYVILFGAVLALFRYDMLRSDLLLAAAAGFAGGLAFWIVIQRISSPNLMDQCTDTIAGKGALRAEFDAQQVVFTTAISMGRMEWRCFDRITALKDATVLKAGGMVYPRPDAALPAGLTPQAFRADLQSWLEASR
jgi:hypothetical protein